MSKGAGQKVLNLEGSPFTIFTKMMEISMPETTKN